MKFDLLLFSEIFLLYLLHISSMNKDGWHIKGMMSVRRGMTTPEKIMAIKSRRNFCFCCGQQKQNSKQKLFLGKKINQQQQITKGKNKINCLIFAVVVVNHRYKQQIVIIISTRSKQMLMMENLTKSK